MESPLARTKIRSKRAFEIEALFASIGDGIIVTDSSARISRVNHVAQDILGFKPNELIGKWFPETIIAEDEQGNELSSIDRPMGQAFLTGKTITARTYYRRKDGSRVPVSLNVSPVIIDGRPVGAIEVFRDISRELELEHAKDEFVAIASHQLRTPATAVKQYIGLLLEGYTEPLTDSQREFLERAYESNERQLQIVQEILKISQLDMQKVIFKPEEFDAMAIIEPIVAGLKSKFAEKDQKFQIIKPAHPVIVRADKVQLASAIENILENASNYTWAGKKISISAKQSKANVLISVSDEGVGIAKKDMPKLFQKFSRLPNPLSIQAGGTGLGLYWAAKVIELHGGKIKVKSAPQKGSTFTICLPKTTSNI